MLGEGVEDVQVVVDAELARDGEHDGVGGSDGRVGLELLDELVGHDLIERRDGFVKATNLPVHQRIDKRYLALCGFCEHDPQSMFGPGDHMGKKS